MTLRRGLAILGMLLAIAAGLTGVAFADRIVYLASAAWFQGDLLWGRVPLDEAMASGRYEEPQLQRLRWVPEIKAYGARIGLSATQNYDTINPDWNQTIWNVSASEPDAFRNKTWWFPIVGPMPYLGFFERPQADALAAELEAEGLDVYVRTAGAYSTLGWFRDPLMPGMLKWSEYDLANTILHELAHATVWIPGSVQFNESFASYVGDAAGRAYMVEKHGAGSDEVLAMEDRIRDSRDWTAFQRQLYRDLDAIYDDASLSRDEKLARKAAIFADLGPRVDAVGFRDPEKYRKAVDKGPWNNARLMQFRTYNRSTDWFRLLHDREGGDLLKFMEAVRTVTAGADDPYRALALAVGADPDAKD